MTTTIWGKAATANGATMWTTPPHMDPLRANVAHPGEHRLGQLPGRNFSHVQPAKVPITLDHDQAAPVGRVGHLETNRDGVLWIVAEVDLDADTLAAAGPVYWSTRTRAALVDGVEHDALLVEVAITDHPAAVALHPLDHRAGSIRDLTTGGWRDVPAIVHRAAELNRYRRPGDPLRIHDSEPALTNRGSSQAARRPMELSYRTAGRILAVR